MSDRSSARIFSEIFELLAENPDERNIRLADNIWGFTYDYDFSPCQLECDDELFKLQLAQHFTDKYGEVCICYKGDEEFKTKKIIKQLKNIKIS
jgi:hypothetical protein